MRRLYRSIAALDWLKLFEIFVNNRNAVYPFTLALANKNFGTAMPECLRMREWSGRHESKDWAVLRVQFHCIR